MKKVNWERGFKRIVWFVSLFGAAVALIAGIVSIVIGVSSGDLRRLDSGIASMAGGIGWYLFWWGLFFLIRWIIKGFQAEGKSESTDS